MEKDVLIENEEVMEVSAEKVAEEVVERPYTLRKLKDSDLFQLLKIFRAIGLKEFKNVIQKAAENGMKEAENWMKEAVEKDDVEKEVGILAVLDMADVIIEHFDTAQDDIYRLWSDISGIPVEEMKEMEFGTLPLMIYDSFREVKNTSFFKVLSKLL